MSTETTATVKMDSTFLTGPGGLVYELPLAEASKYVVTPQRVKELGHLPVVPYGTQGSASTAASAETSDVEGRHLAWNPTFGWVWHSNYLYGPFLAADGFYYRGVHYHPYGNELGFL